MYVGKILSRLGGQGPVLLVISVCAGLLITPLAHFGYDLLPFSAFLLTLGSFLTAGLAPSEAKIRLPLIAIVLAWVGVALPLAAAGVLTYTTPALVGGGKLVWAYGTYLFMMVCYTGINIPYNALSGVIGAQAAVALRAVPTTSASSASGCARIARACSHPI